MEQLLQMRKKKLGPDRTVHFAFIYRGAVKSLARPGKEQANVSVRMA